MKALVMQAPWVLTVEEVSTPEPGPDDVLIKIAATGICGSDFHGFSGENGRRKPGQIMGHETVGHVAKVGGNVVDLVEGTCVTVNPVLSCDDCDVRSEEHTSELQSLRHLVCRLLLEKKNT